MAPLELAVTSGTFPPGCTSTSGYSTTTGVSCGGTTTTTSSTQTYQNSTYGVSFNYPNTWTNATDASATSEMGNYGFSIPSNATSLITLKVPTTAYPGTDFGGGYLNLSVSKQLNASQCLALNPQNGSTPGQGTVNIGGVTFNWTSMGGAAAGTDTSNTSYSGYTNGTCYEFNYSDVYYSGGIGTNGITGTSAPENDIKNAITSATFYTPSSTSTTTSSPTISGVSGPQTLKVNQTGTWTVNASDSNNGNLSYSVNWGDEPSLLCGMTSCATNTNQPYSLQQSSTFTHSYALAKTFTPTFTVTNTAGLTAQTSLSVVVNSGITACPAWGCGGPRTITPVSTTNVSSPVVTNTTATLGSAIIQNNTTVGYNATYAFTLVNNSNNDFFVSTSPSSFVSTVTAMKTAGTGSGYLTSVTSTPVTVNGDNTSVYVIPAGTSRAFTFSAALYGTSGSSTTFGITQINYGTTSTSPATLPITDGLSALGLTASF
jgi:hypothetical protein